MPEAFDIGKMYSDDVRPPYGSDYLVGDGPESPQLVRRRGAPDRYAKASDGLGNPNPNYTACESTCDFSNPILCDGVRIAVMICVDIQKCPQRLATLRCQTISSS